MMSVRNTVVFATSVSAIRTSNFHQDDILPPISDVTGIFGLETRDDTNAMLKTQFGDLLGFEEPRSNESNDSDTEEVVTGPVPVEQSETLTRLENQLHKAFKKQDLAKAEKLTTEIKQEFERLAAAAKQVKQQVKREKKELRHFLEEVDESYVRASDVITLQNLTGRNAVLNGYLALVFSRTEKGWNCILNEADVKDVAPWLDGNFGWRLDDVRESQMRFAYEIDHVRAVVPAKGTSMGLDLRKEDLHINAIVDGSWASNFTSFVEFVGYRIVKVDDIEVSDIEDMVAAQKNLKAGEAVEFTLQKVAGEDDLDDVWSAMQVSVLSCSLGSNIPEMN